MNDWGFCGRRHGSDGQRAFVPDFAGLFAVSHPLVALVGGLGAAAEGLADLRPAGPSGACPGDGEVLFDGQLGDLGGELFDPAEG